MRRRPGTENPAWDPRQTGPPVARPWDQPEEFEPTLNSGSQPPPEYLGDGYQGNGELPQFGAPADPGYVETQDFDQPQPAYDPGLGDALVGPPTDLNSDPFGFAEEKLPDEKGRPRWQGTAVQHEADVPGAPEPAPSETMPPPVPGMAPAPPVPGMAPAPPSTPDPTSAPKPPFGGLNPTGTDMHSQSKFRPDLQTRIFQNPFADPSFEMQPAGVDEQPTTAAVGGQPAMPRVATGTIQAVPEPSPDAGKLVVFFSCHGGSGSTMLATNTAAAVAATGQPACIMDLDLQLGSVLTALGIESQCPMSKVISDMETYEWQMLAPLLARHHSGLCVLSQVGHIEELSAMDPARVPVFFRYLQEYFKFLVVDGLRDFNDHALAAMDVADKVVLVSTQDVAAVRGAGMRIDILKRLGFPGEKIHLLINRYDRRSKVTLERISDALGIPPSFTVPNDFRSVSSALVRGNTLEEGTPDSKVSRAVINVARALFDLPPLPKKKGLFDKLFGGSKKQKKQ